MTRDCPLLGEFNSELHTTERLVDEHDAFSSTKPTDLVVETVELSSRIQLVRSVDWSVLDVFSPESCGFSSFANANFAKRDKRSSGSTDLL